MIVVTPRATVITRRKPAKFGSLHSQLGHNALVGYLVTDLFRSMCSMRCPLDQSLLIRAGSPRNSDQSQS